MRLELNAIPIAWIDNRGSLPGRLYIGMENGHPFTIFLFPHGSGIVGT
jgi:hypothetical protein